MRSQIRSFPAEIDALRAILRRSEHLARLNGWADRRPLARSGGQR
jgi:hypothetical protein